jgi:hypothetical protein
VKSIIDQEKKADWEQGILSTSYQNDRVLTGEYWSNKEAITIIIIYYSKMQTVKY